jgi:hypothetical protein
MRDRSVAELLSELLRRTHLSAPTDLPALVAEQGRTIGTQAVELYMIDYDQQWLLPLPASATDQRDAIAVTGTVAGKAYSSTTILESQDGEPGTRRLWLPLLDGTERLGVMAMTFPEESEIAPEMVALCERYAHLVATLMATKGAYTDAFELARRQRPKTIAAELVWELAPPLVFATDDLVVAGMLEPAYDNGGDALDYALNGDVLHLAVLDAMGHGLAAAGLATFALSAYRHARRRGCGLIETYRNMDAAIADHASGDAFVTGLVAELDVATGRLAWFSAGHPPPLVIRDDRHTHLLELTPSTPLGVGWMGDEPPVGSESLEPGDLLLLYTDGLTDARLATGERLGLDGLRQFVEREAAAANIAPETLRRLRNAIVGAHPDGLEDDASGLLIEWRRGGERKLVPPTV